MEETAEHWDEFWRTSNVRYTHDTTIAAIEGLKIDNVLEIGAGSGRDLQELKARGYSVAFADWSGAMMDSGAPMAWTATCASIRR